MTKYILQRWWVGEGWKSIENFKDKKTAIHAFNGWCKQIRDGTFRIITGSGYIVKKRYGTLYKKMHGRKSKR